MKSKTLLLLSFFPLFLLQACGGGSIVLKSTDGSKVSFKKENVFCERGIYINIDEIICTANGVKTDLTNRQSVFSDERMCLRIDKRDENGEKLEIKKISFLDDEYGFTFTCSAAKEFGMLEINALKAMKAIDPWSSN